MSSGVYVITRDEMKQCDGKYYTPTNPDGWDCMFDGWVEVSYDREVQEAWWECPLCGTEHNV